jgi:hypothetical protein
MKAKYVIRDREKNLVIKTFCVVPYLFSYFLSHSPRIVSFFCVWNLGGIWIGISGTLGKTVIVQLSRLKVKDMKPVRLAVI